MKGRKNMNTRNTLSQVESEVNSFDDLKKTVEEEANTGKDFTNDLLTLSEACVMSVLKKIYISSCDETIRKARNEVFHEMSKYRKPVTEEEEKGKTIGFIPDLINTAFISLWGNITKDIEHGITVDLDRKYTIRKLSKRVVIRKETSRGAWKNVTTCHMVECYHAIREYIYQNGNLSCDNPYTYIEEMTTDEETDKYDVLYRRLPKYAQAGSYAQDFNHSETFYTVSEEEASDFFQIEEVIEKLNLTNRQKEVLALRYYKGYGIKAIATYYDVSHQSVAKILKQIQTKYNSYLESTK